MGKITKTVIEDIAYELKRTGIIINEYRSGNMSAEKRAEFALDFDDSLDVLDWIIDDVHEVFATHDPTFNSNKFREQVQYRLDQNI